MTSQNNCTKYHSHDKSESFISILVPSKYYRSRNNDGNRANYLQTHLFQRAFNHISFYNKVENRQLRYNTFNYILYKGHTDLYTLYIQTKC